MLDLKHSNALKYHVKSGLSKLTDLTSSLTDLSKIRTGSPIKKKHLSSESKLVQSSSSNDLCKSDTNKPNARWEKKLPKGQLIKAIN